MITINSRQVFIDYYQCSLEFHQHCLNFINTPDIIFEHEQVLHERLLGFGFSTKLLYEIIKTDLLDPETSLKLNTLQRCVINQHSTYIVALRQFAYMGQKHSYTRLINSQLVFETLLSNHV